MKYIMIALLAIAFLATGKANSHSWYDPQCCSNRDCEPIPFEAVTETNDGWVVTYVSSRGFPMHAFVPRGKQKESQDGRYHACANPTRFLCLYVPVNV